MVSTPPGRPSFAVVLGLTTAAFFVLNALLTVRYESNDDTGMLLIAAGEYHGTADNHLVFVNFLYGSLLNALYAAADGVEWYTVLIVGATVLATAVIAWAVARLSLPRRLRGALLLLTSVIFADAVVQLQFTKAAGLLTVAGLLLVYRGDRKWGGGLLLALASLLRFEMVALVALAAAPAYLPRSRALGAYLSDARVRALALAGLACVSLRVADRVYYASDREWAEFVAYNRLRGRVNDNPNAPALARLPEGIAAGDYELLLNFFPNSSAIGEAELASLLEAVGEVGPARKVRNGLRATWLYRYHFAYLLTFAIALAYCSGRHRARIVLTFAVLLGLAFYIATDGSVKDRIFYGAILASTLSMAVLSAPRREGLGPWAAAGAVVLYAAFLSIATYGKARDNAANARAYRDQAAVVADYLASGRTLVPYMGRYRLEHGSPFAVSASHPAGRVLFNGWFAEIPFNRGRFESFAVFGEGYGLLTDRKDSTDLHLIARSIRRETGRAVVPHVVAAGDRVAIVEFRGAR